MKMISAAAFPLALDHRPALEQAAQRGEGAVDADPGKQDAKVEANARVQVEDGRATRFKMLCRGQA